MLNSLIMLAVFAVVGAAIYIMFTQRKMHHDHMSDFFIGVVLVILLTFEIPCALYLLYLLMPHWVVGQLFKFYLFYFLASHDIIQVFYIAPIVTILAQRKHWRRMSGVIAAALSVSAFVVISSFYFPFTF